MEYTNKTGVIKDIKGNELIITMQSCSACSSCSLKHHCSMSENKNKELRTITSTPEHFSIGEEIIVSIAVMQGIYAVILGYLIPLILLLLSIIITTFLTNNEFIGGISGIIVLIPYYFGLFLAQDKLKSHFNFKVSKKDVRN